MEANQASYWRGQCQGLPCALLQQGRMSQGGKGRASCWEICVGQCAGYKVGRGSKDSKLSL